MKTTAITEKSLLFGRLRWFLMAFCLLIIVSTLLGALSIPFLYETQTLWYKFGIDRILLRTGQILGLFAAVSLYVQILLAARLPLLDRLIGLDQLLRIHRLNGFMLLSLTISHVLLILIPEGLNNLPIGWKFWPELVGAMTFLLLLPLILSSAMRQSFKIPYNVWRYIHGPVGFSIFILLGIHILFVSDSFENSRPRAALLLIMGSIILLLIFTKIRKYLENRDPWIIKTVEKLNNAILRIDVQPPTNKRFSYAPGQFAFLTVNNKNLSSEPHPFTIASSPSQDHLQFIIKNSGDWTEKLSAIQPGDTAHVVGPYGRFSYTHLQSPNAFVMIAGGIGITPILSMLRHMAASSDVTKDITLIWSNRHRTDLVCKKELQELQKRLPHLKTHLIYTSKKEKDGGRLNHKRLSSLVPSIKSSVFLCGPPGMIQSTKKLLLQQGFKRKQIFYELFSL